MATVAQFKSIMGNVWQLSLMTFQMSENFTFVLLVSKLILMVEQRDVKL